MDVIKLEVDHEDDRGKIMDILSNEQINAITYISFKKGAIRGNHFHKDTTQWNYVISGKVTIVHQDMDVENGTGNGPVKTITLGKGECAVNLPKEAHAIKAEEDSEIMVFTRGPRGGKEYESDTFRLQEPLI